MKKKRWAVELALCLLAGAVVTWAVAWGCVRRGEWLRFERTRFIDAPSGWPRLVPSGWLPPSHVTQEADRFRTRLVASRLDDVEDKCAFAMSFGWPSRAMAWTRITTSPNNEMMGVNVHVVVDTRFIMAPTNDPDLDKELPTEVLPLGFALDTLLYGGAVLGVVEGAGFARRRVRRHKGRCPACGYDRRGLANDATCPECGGKA